MDTIAKGQLAIGPLRLESSAKELTRLPEKEIDAILFADWNGSSEKFAVEIKARSTPKNIRSALWAARAAASSEGLAPMIVVPFLSDAALSELEREGVSGVDLCGNGVVIVPGKWFIRQSGAPNRYPDSAPIKNVYRGKSSQTARAFLLRPRYRGIRSILQNINERSALSRRLGPAITLSTVSKAVKALVEDLVVGREKDRVMLLQPEKLLDALAENYRPPQPSRTFGWRMNGSGRISVIDALRAAFASEIPAVMTGLSSTTKYASMQRSEPRAVYCVDPEAWLANLPGAVDERFPTVRIIETREAPLYFDARASEGIVYASPVQTYLELRRGDKRDREASLQVMAVILQELQEGEAWID